MTPSPKAAAIEALIEAHAVELKLTTVKRRFRALAEEATREQQTPVVESPRGSWRLDRLRGSEPYAKEAAVPA